MCHYIMALLPESADVEAVREIARRFQRSLDLTTDRKAKIGLEPSERLYHTTQAHCDCGTALGSLATGRGKGPDDHSSTLNKFRKKGWSEAKIQRWLDQMKKNEGKQEREREALAAQGHLDAKSWLELVRSVIGSGASSKIGLLLYWIDPKWDEIASRGRVRTKTDQLDVDLLLRMEEDRIYEFSASVRYR